MTPRGRGTGAFSLCVAGCMAACAQVDAPREGVLQPIAPYQVHEDCLPLAPGDRLGFHYSSDEPVAFNLHYRAGNAVVVPMSREASLDDGGVFAPVLRQRYCLSWEAGAAGAQLRYHLRVQRADP